jgi:hypothetical protein
VNNLGDYPLLLVNVAKNENHWLGLKLTGTTSNRSAIGARVTLHGAKRNWVDEVHSGSSFDSSSDLRLHFGLGAETKITRIDVRWPNGESEQFPCDAVDRITELIEGQGKPLH